MLSNFRIKKLSPKEWHDYIPQIDTPTNFTHVDLGAGNNPRNPFAATRLVTTDISQTDHNKQFLDLTRPLPFESNTIFSFSAFDVLEHIPRWERKPNNEICYPFVNLISEIYRCLVPNGIFIAVSPVFPSESAFTDPTHLNILPSKH